MSHLTPFALRSRLAAWSAVAVFFLALATPARAHRIEKSFRVDLRPVVTVRNASGRITVRPWQKPEVRVVADHVSEKVETDAAQMGNRVDVVTHLLSENVAAAELKADYEITVPEQTELQIRNDSGLIVVKGISGEMTFDTVASDVSLEDVYGYLVIKTIGGSLDCTRCAGRIEVTSISGNVRLSQAVSYNVRAQTYSGSLFFDGDFQPGGVYILKNVEGPIEVRFSEHDSFSLSAISIQGTVDNQATLKPLLHKRQTSPRLSRSLFGTVNEGLARLELTSFSGTIKILKRQ